MSINLGQTLKQRAGLSPALEAYVALESPVDMAPLDQALMAAIEGDPSSTPEESDETTPEEPQP